MDKQLQDFFNHLHQIIGFDADAARADIIDKIENAIFDKSLIFIVQGLDGQKRAMYDEFIRKNPSLTAADLKTFLETVMSADEIEQCIANASREVVEQYVKTILQVATDEQKQRILAVFEGLIDKTNRSFLIDIG